jgi:hypothetical protein
MMIQNPVHLMPDTPVSVLVPTLLPDTDTLAFDGMSLTEQCLTLHLHTTVPATICPTCQQPTTQVHSRYQRTLQDTAWGVCLVQLRLTVRRFRCANPACRCTAFTERLPQLAPHAARRTARLCREHGQIAHALGGALQADLSPVPEKFHDFFHGFPMHFRTKRRVCSCHSAEHHFLPSGMWCPDLGSQTHDTCEKYTQRSWHAWKTSLKKYATLRITNER